VFILGELEGLSTALSSCHQNVPEKIVPECYHQLVKILDLTSESWFQVGPDAISRRHI